MDTCPNPGLAEQYAAALDWWHEAGVDMDFSDTPTAWLSDPPPNLIRESQAGGPGSAQGSPAPAACTAHRWSP
jgi:uracil-DNA glycosylase